MEGQILEVNDQVLNLFGYTLKESKSLKLSDLVEPGDLSIVIKNIEYVIANGVNQGCRNIGYEQKKEEKYLLKLPQSGWIGMENHML